MACLRLHTLVPFARGDGLRQAEYFGDDHRLIFAQDGFHRGKPRLVRRNLGDEVGRGGGVPARVRRDFLRAAILQRVGLYGHAALPPLGLFKQRVEDFREVCDEPKLHEIRRYAVVVRFCHALSDHATAVLRIALNQLRREGGVRRRRERAAPDGNLRFFARGIVHPHPRIRFNSQLFEKIHCVMPPECPARGAPCARCWVRKARGAPAARTSGRRADNRPRSRCGTRAGAALRQAPPAPRRRGRR